MLNKMLRATITKLKKVCFDSWTPRIFRGDYYIPVSATTLSRAHKSTDSGKGSQDDDEKCKKLIDELFNTKLEGLKIHEDPTTDLNIRDLKRQQVELTSPKEVTPQETQCQICERLISQAFGKEGDDKLPNDVIVSATTDKQAEEQLEQKVEAFDETPLVEAAKPKIEGFNVNPKVLGAEEEVRLETLNFDNNKENDGGHATVINEKTNNDLEGLCQKIERSNRFYHAGKNLYKMPEFNHFENQNSVDPAKTGMTYVGHPYDDIAKRCIDIPPNKIDRHILRELQRLGVPNSGGYGSNSNNTGNVGDFNLQRGNSYNSSPDDQVLYPPYENEQLKVERPMIYELDKKPLPLCMMEQNVIDDTLITLASVGPKPDFNPNRMILDPFDKRSLCYDCVDPEYEVLSSYSVHVLVQRLENKDYHEQSPREQTEYSEYSQTNQTYYAGQSEQANYPGQSEQASYMGQSEQANYAAQSEQINYGEQSAQSNYAQQSEHQTQSPEQIHVRPEFQDYEIKPLHESPRLPEKPINLCNENNTIHPANREEHYSMDRFEECERLHHQKNYQENMVPNKNHQPAEQEYVNIPENNQNRQHIAWNSDYQNLQNYYGNRFQGGEQHQMTPDESPPKVDLPNEQQTYSHPAVHVFTNAATDKSDKPSETLETILAHRQNITAEEVAEDIKHQRSKQVTDISDENTSSEQSHQLHFNEQSPKQHVQFQPTENDQSTEQEHLGRPIEPMHVSINDQCDLFDLRREPDQFDKKAQKAEQVHIVGSVKADPEYLDKKEQPAEKTHILGAVKAHSEQLDLREQKQPNEQAQILGSLKAQSDQVDKTDQRAEPNILGVVKAHAEQLDYKEQKQPNEQAQILGSVKADPEPLEKKEEPAKKAHILGAVKAHSEQLDFKEQKQPHEQAQILGSVKADPEPLDKKEELAKKAHILGVVKAHAEQLDFKEQKQPNEQAQILGSVKADPEPLEKKEEPAKKAHILGAVKAHSEELDFKEQKQPNEQAQILGSVKADPEPLDKKEEPAKKAHILGAVKAHSEKIDLKEQKQPNEQAQILGSMKAQSDQVDKKEQRAEQSQILGSVKISNEQLHLNEQKQSSEQPQLMGSIKANEEPLEKKEQPTVQAHILRSVKAHPEQHDLKEQKQQIEQHKIMGSIKTHEEQLDIKEQTEILGSVKTDREQFDKKAQPAEHAHLLGSVKADPEPLDKKEQPAGQANILGSVKANIDLFNKEAQIAEQAHLLGSVKADPETLDKKEQPAGQANILGSVKANIDLFSKEAQIAEQAHLLGSVKADPEPLDKNEQSDEKAHILVSVKAQSEQLDLKEQKLPIEHLKILGSVKAHPEPIDKKEQSTEKARILVAEEPISLKEQKQLNEQAQLLGKLEQVEKKEQRAEANILGVVKANNEKLDLKEQKQPIQLLKILSATKAHPEQKENSNERAKEDPVEKSEVLAGGKVLGSVIAHQEEVKDKKEVPIEHSEVLASVSARQERLNLKRQAIEQLKVLNMAKVNPEKIEKKDQAIDHDRLLSSVKPQKQDDLKEQTTEEAQVFNAVKIQEAPAEKAETTQPEPKPEPEDPDEFRKQVSSTALPLPKIDIHEKLPLSVILKRLRQRSKIETCQDLITRSDPVGKKCGCPPPPCPPPAPTCPPPKPCPPPPCPPPPPPCPKPCKPACPNPCGPPKPCCPPKKPPCCSNYIQVDTDFDFAAILRETDIYLKKHMYETVTAILTKEVVLKLEKMGVSLLITYPNEDIDSNNIEVAEVTAENTGHSSEDCQVNSTGVDLAKDYEPWVPIPSWPIPRKVKKRPLVCPKDGCKIIPPPRLNPPCTQNPCTGFPKRRNSFSTPDSADLSEDVSVRYES